MTWKIICLLIHHLFFSQHTHTRTQCFSALQLYQPLYHCLRTFVYFSLFLVFNACCILVWAQHISPSSSCLISCRFCSTQFPNPEVELLWAPGMPCCLAHPPCPHHMACPWLRRVLQRPFETTDRGSSHRVMISQMKPCLFGVRKDMLLYMWDKEKENKARM